MDFDEILTMDKVESILSEKAQKSNKELGIDKRLKKIVEVMFKREGEIRYPKLNDPKILLPKFIEILFELFKLDGKSRLNFYKKDINDISHTIIKNSINYCKINNNYETLINEKYKTLYKKLKEKITSNSLYHFICTLLFDLIFRFNEKYPLEFAIFSIISNNYLKKYSKKFDESDIESDLENPLCLSIIIDIFSDKFKDETLIFFCLIALKFKVIKRKHSDVNKLLLMKATENILSQKICFNINNNNEIINLISKELTHININQEISVENLENMNIDFKDDSNNRNREPEPLDNDIISIFDIKEEDNILNSVNVNTDIINIKIDKIGDNSEAQYKNKLPDLLKIILNKVEMDNTIKEELTREFNQIQDFINNLTDRNDSLFNEINIIKNDNSKLHLKIKDMEESQTKFKVKMKNEMENQNKFKVKMKNEMENKEKKLNSTIMEMKEKIAKLEKDALIKDNKINHINQIIKRIADHLICPITNSLIEDPLVTFEGHTYENKGIKDWLEKHETDPNTRTNIKGTPFYPNFAIMNISGIIKKYEENNMNNEN